MVSGRLAQETPEPRFFFSRDVLTLFCRLWGFSWNRPAPHGPTESGTWEPLWPLLVGKEDRAGSMKGLRLEGADISGLKETQQNQGTHQVFPMSPSGGGHAAVSPRAYCAWLSQFYRVGVRLGNVLTYSATGEVFVYLREMSHFKTAALIVILEQGSSTSSAEERATVLRTRDCRDQEVRGIQERPPSFLPPQRSPWKGIRSAL